MMFFNGLFFCVYNASVYKTNAQNGGGDDSLSDHTLTLAGAVGSVCNGGSTLFWALFVEKFGFKKVYFMIMGLELAVSLTIYHARESASLYLACVALSFFCQGGHFTLFPTVSLRIFGI